MRSLVATCGHAHVLVSRAILGAANQGEAVGEDVLEELVSRQRAVSHVLPAAWRERGGG